MSTTKRDQGRRKEESEIADRIHTASLWLLRRVRRVDDDVTELSPARLSVLSVLVFGGGPRTLGELASIERVKPPTMTGLVRGLEDDGYVERFADEHDGRVTRVRATKKGEGIVSRARKRRIDAIAGMFSTLDPTEVETIGQAAALMEKMLGATRSENASALEEVGGDPQRRRTRGG